MSTDLCTLTCDRKDDLHRAHTLPVDRFDQGDAAVDAVDAEEVSADGVRYPVSVRVRGDHLADDGENTILISFICRELI